MKSDLADQSLAQVRHSELLSGLTNNLADLQADVAELKAAVLEILRMLPPPEVG